MAGQAEQMAELLRLQQLVQAEHEQQQAQLLAQQQEEEALAHEQAVLQQQAQLQGLHDPQQGLAEADYGDEEGEAQLQALLAEQGAVPVFQPDGVGGGYTVYQHSEAVAGDMSDVQLQQQQQQPAFHQQAPAAFQAAAVRIPPHRMTPLRDNWMDIYSPLVEHLGLQVRMNTRTKSVEARECEATLDATTLQKAVKFLEAFALGFEVGDALAVLRLDDLYVESFNVEDVKQVIQGDHMSRAIGRVAGKDGKTKFAIENATRTRIVLADRRIHILGSFQNIKIARHAVCDLILGSPPGKVYAHLRAVSSRTKEQF